MLQHNRQWLRWVPFLLWVAAVIALAVWQEESFDLAMSVALVSAPVGVGIPILGAVICHRPRSRRVYAAAAIAGGGAIVLMLLMVLVAALLSEIGSGKAFAADAAYTFGQLMMAVGPLLLGALMTTVLMVVWTYTAPKPQA